MLPSIDLLTIGPFLFLDSIYTERYMGLPSFDDNKRGYEQSRLTALYENFRNRKYMLIHGTYDDNVHFQQAMQLSRALETHDIMFKQVVSNKKKYEFTVNSNRFSTAELPR